MAQTQNVPGASQAAFNTLSDQIASLVKYKTFTATTDNRGTSALGTSQIDFTKEVPILAMTSDGYMVSFSQYSNIYYAHLWANSNGSFVVAASTTKTICVWYLER